MKNSYPRSNSFLDSTSFIKYSILLFLIAVFAVNTATAQCGLGTASQVAAAPTMTGTADATWASAPVNTIGANPNNTVTNNSANAPLSSLTGTNDGFAQLATNTSREPGFAATWQAQWTSTTLYILVQVTDASVNFDPIPNDQFFYNYDAVEVYLSGNNNHAAGAPNYGPDDVQYGFSNGVYRGIGGGSGAGSSTVGVTETSVLTGSGYNMAITIPLSSFSAPGTMNSQVSFDIAVDDDDHLANILTKMTADSTTLVNTYGQSPAAAHTQVDGFESGGDYRDAQMAWNATTGEAPYDNPSQLSNLILTAPPTTATAHNQSICGSGIITLAGNAPLIGTGQWTATGGLANLSQLSGGTNNPTATFNSAGLGTYIFTWSILNNPCSAIPSTANDTISVTPLPLLLITNPAAVCSPGTVDITAPAVTAGSSGGTILTYYTDAATTIPLATPTAVATSGTYYIKSTSTSNCITITPVTVTINISPIITVTSANPTACLSSTGSFTVNGLIPGTIYTINFDAGGIAQTPQTLTATAAGTVTVTGLPQGSYTNIIAVPPAGCVSNAGSATLTDPAAPTPIASTGGTVCAGGNLTLASTLTGGATYTWSGPGGYTATGATQTINPATSADSGLYTVTVTLAGCVGTSSIVGTVNPTPVLVITNPAAICAPSGIDITAPAVTAGSTLPPATVLSYYTDLGDVTAVATPTNITTSGTYYIKAVSGLGCSVTAPVTVTINPQPAIVVTSTNPTACATSTGSFAISGLTAGATYTINFSEGGVPQPPQILVANAAGTIIVTTLPAGSYTNITATSAAGCTSNTSTTTLTDPAAPTPTASTGGTVCTGGSLTLASTLTGGATYTWTGPGGYTATGATQTISPATSADSGLYTVTVTLAGCVGTSSIVGTVNPTPLLVITNPAAICAPSGIDITAPAVTAGSTLPPATVLSYYTDPGDITAVAIPTNITTGGTYYIKAVSGLGCSVTAPVTVTINPQPAIAVTSTNPTTCATSTGSFAISGLTSGATYTINFSEGGIPQAPQILVANGTGTITVTTLPAGSYTNITATSAVGCISNTSTTTLIDPAAPTPTASTGGTVCTGGSLTLASTLTGGATYTWTGPGGYTATGATQTISPATSADSGLYTVTVTLAGCVGTSSIVGTVNPTPVLVITNPAAICAPSGIDITAPAVTAGSTLPPATVLSYYTDLGDVTAVATPTNITTSGTYYIKAVSGLGCSVTAPITVTINPQPAIVVTSTNPTACATSTGSFAISGLTAGATYTINFSEGGVPQPPQILVANAAGTIIVTTLPAGSYTNITATSAAGCTSNTSTTTLTDPAAPTPTAGTLGAVCSGNILSLTSTPTAGAAYSWSGPNGFTSTLANPTIPAALSADSGMYTVTVTLTGCTGTSSVDGIVNQTPVLTITNPTVICSFVSLDITLPAITAGSTLPTGTTLSYYTDAAATIPLATPTNVTASGTYYIKALTGSSCSDIEPVVVTISPLPPITITETDPTACATSTGTFTVNGLTAGISYTINFDKDGVAQTPQVLTATAAGTITISGLPAGSYTAITATVAAGCVSNTGSATLSDPTAPTPTAGTLGAVCSGNTLSLTSTPTVGATYSWSGPNGFSSTLQNPTIPLALYADSGVYNLTVTLTGCTGNSNVVGVVHPTPVLTITNPAALCAPGTIDITVPAITAGSTLPSDAVLSYYTDAAATITLAIPTSITASGTYYIKALTGSGCSDVEPVIVTINPLPILTITNPAAVCFPSTVDITVPAITTGSTVGTTLSYYTDAAATIALTTPTVVIASNTYYIKSVTASGCSVIAPVTVAINPLPVLTISDPAAVCAPTTVDITAPAVTIGSTGGTTLSYYTDAAATITLVTPTAIAASGTYYIKSTTLSGCSVIAPVTVTINPLPVLTITNPPAVCSPATVDITIPAITTGSTGGTTLNYYTDAAATITLVTPTDLAASGTYYIKSVTASGCSVIAPVTVTINPLPVLTITNPPAACSPSTVDITAAAVTAGSTLSGGVLSYYTDAAATLPLAAPAAVTTSNIYYIKAVTAAGCSAIAPVTVTINPTPVLAITNPAAVCSPTTVDITAAAVTAGSTLSGGALSYYTDAAATIPYTTPSTIGASATYYIKAATGSGCSVIAPVTVTINPTPVLVIHTPASVCSPTTVDITAAAVTVGSTLPPVTTLSYYTDAAATIPLATPTTVGAGTYYIKAATGSGCSDIKPVTVTTNPTPVLVIQVPDAQCSPKTIDITNPTVALDNSTLPTGTTVNYYSDPAATIVLPNPESTDSGTYYIKAITPQGCSDTAAVPVNIYTSPLPPTVAPLQYCQGDGDVPALTADRDAGNTLLWYTTSIGGAGSPSAPVPSIENGDVTLSFFVTQTQTHVGVSCESNTRAELNVRITTTPKVTVNPSLIQEYAGVPVSLDGQATGDSTTRTVTWNTEGIFGFTAFAFTEITTVTPPSAIVPIDSTRYYFIATSIEDGQCADTASVLVKVLQPLLIPNIFSPNGDGINDIWDIKYIQEFDNAEVSIFNRYGQFIYKSNDGYRTPWDGTYHGDPVPVGSYFYIIKTTPDAKPISGYVAVVR